MAKRKQQCECSDPGCPVHKGTSECKQTGIVILKRIDMDDMTGVMFCPECGDDAFDSGVFAYAGKE